MEVILSRSVAIHGVGYAAGTRLNLTDDEGKVLLSMGKATVAPAPVLAETTPEPDQEESDPVQPGEDAVSAETAETPSKGGRKSDRKS